MMGTTFTFLRHLPGAVANYSVGLLYTQSSYRYLLYFLGCLLIGIWTYVALEIYGRLTWRVTSISFRGNYILHTIINFGICLYVCDEWLARLTGRWGRYDSRTLGKQALIWGGSFLAAFYVQRTIVFEGIQYYALDTYHYYQLYPQMRPRPLDNFLFCLPFFFGTIVLLCLIAFARQRGLKKERQILVSQLQRLAAKEKALQDIVPVEKNDSELAPLYVQIGSSQIILEKDSISHVTVEDHYCRIYTLEDGVSNSYYVKSSLADLLKKLPQSQFIQIHRSHVVNMQAIRQLDKKSRASKVYLKSDVMLPVSRHRLSEVMARIKSRMWWNRETAKGKQTDTGHTLVRDKN